MGGYAWVTLATNDAYSLGALVLAHSLRRVGTKYELAVLVTPGVTEMMREKLAAVFSVVQEVNVLDSRDEANLALLARPELGITFTKLHCWRLTQYEKCVFVDADTLVVRNCDELFEREELSAAPDVGWPDCFNSGVFVFRPSQQTFASITAFASAKGSFDGGDQGLLNMYFNDWARKDISKHLPFIYNMCSTATYSYLPAFKQFGEDVRIIHFIGITKPWLQYLDTLTGIVQPPAGSVHLQPLLQLWWNIFCEKVHPQLSPVMATSTLAPIWHEYFPTSFESPIPKSPLYTDVTNNTCNDSYSQIPDFSEFKDPWESYTENNSIIHDNKANHEIQQCFCTTDQSCFELSCSKCNFIKPVYQTCYESSTKYSDQFYNQKQYEYHLSSPLTQQFDHNYDHFNKLSGANEHQKVLSIIESRPPENLEQQTQSTYQQDQDRINHFTCTHNDHNKYSNQSQEHHKQYQPIESSHSREVQHVEYNCIHNKTDNVSHIKTQKQENCMSQNNYNTYYQHNLQDIQHEKYNVMNQDHSIPNEQEKPQNNNEHKNDCTQKINSQNNDQNSAHIIKQHEYFVQNTILHQNCNPLTKYYQQSENITITDRQNHELKSVSPHPVPIPCTDLHNIATQSDPHITEHLDNSNAGLAGALAQMTLGEPRSAEQIAFEEHMRKQSWEQGQIDYMGRDSFDNIWKKICETLSFAPQRLPSPPKETIMGTETATEVATPKSVEPVDSAKAEVEANKTAEVTASLPEEQSLINDVPVDKILMSQELTTNDTIPAKANESMLSKLPEKNEQTPDLTLTSLEKDAKQLAEVTDLQEERREAVPQKRSVELECQLHATNIDSSITQLPIQTSTEIVTEELPASSLPKEKASEQTITAQLSCKIDQPLTELPAKQNLDETVPDSNITTDIVSEGTVEKGKSVEPHKHTDDSAIQSAATEEQKLDTSTKLDEPHCEKSDSCSLVPIPTSLLQSVDDKKSGETSEFDIIQPKEISNIEKEQHAEVLSTASEVLTVSPVPIQVAESVLQTEPKESILDTQIIGQEVLSSTVTPVQECATSCEPLTKPEDKMLLNGTDSATIPAQKDETTRVDTVPSIENASTQINYPQTESSAEQPKPILEEASVPQDTEKIPETQPSVEQCKPAVKETTALPPDTEKTTQIVPSVEESKPVLQDTSAFPLDTEKIPQTVPSVEQCKSVLEEASVLSVDSEKIPQTIPSAEQSKPVPEETSPLPLDTEKIPQTVSSAEQSKPESVPEEASVLTEKSIVLSETIGAKENLQLTGSLQGIEKSETTAKELIAPAETSSKSETTMATPPTEDPVRPIRAKELNIPATPTVTEATPPTSPPINVPEDLENQEKVTKKTSKKTVEKSMSEGDSTEVAEGDTAEKKAVKKVVKKVVKKPKSKPEDAPDDGVESSSSSSKQKKTVKVVKKGTKPSQTLGTDTTVPETPPPSTSDTPIPPKRKVKSTTPKTVTKKSDAE